MRVEILLTRPETLETRLQTFETRRSEPGICCVPLQEVILGSDVFRR